MWLLKCYIQPLRLSLSVFMDDACWMCFVAGIHPSWTWMSGSFESVWWTACQFMEKCKNLKLLQGVVSEPVLALIRKNPFNCEGQTQEVALHRIAGSVSQCSFNWAFFVPCRNPVAELAAAVGLISHFITKWGQGCLTLESNAKVLPTWLWYSRQMSDVC